MGVVAAREGARWTGCEESHREMIGVMESRISVDFMRVQRTVPTIPAEDNEVAVNLAAPFIRSGPVRY